MTHWGLKTIFFFLTAVLIIAVASSGYAGTSDVAGTIRFETADGTAGSAAWTRVYLVRDRVPIPPAPVEHGLIPYSPTDRINTAHQDFYANVQQALAQTEFLAASTLVGEDDGFRFSGIPTGRYYVLVAFPSSIDGYKVAWQVPVQVGQDHTVEVVLNQANLILPTFSRLEVALIIKPGM